MMGFWSSKNDISSKYTFSSSPTFVVEPWSVYTGRPKSSSSSSSSASSASGAGSSKVSIFVFDKKRFETYLLNYGIIKSKSSSADRRFLDEAYEILGNHVNNLAKFRHPNVLTLIEPLEVHSKNMLFVTEYVTGSLESAFSGADNGETPDEDDERFLKGYMNDAIVIQRGILQLISGLDFIHNKATSVHLNIQPSSIFINENSDWKISGLGFMRKLPQSTGTGEYYFPQYDPRTPSFMTINLDYAAPEVVFDNSVSCRSDYFSLGLLINFLYTGKNNIINAEGSTSQYKSEYTKFERKLGSMSWDNVFNKLPPKLRTCIPYLMNRDVYARYSNITEFLDSEFFQDPLVKTLNFLDDLPTKSNDEKLIFLNGLVDLLPQYPSSLLIRKFLPILADLLDQLCNDKVIDEGCISKDLEIIIKIGSSLSQLGFSEKVFAVMTRNKNFQVLLKYATLCLIDNLLILKNKVKSSDFLEVILNPLLKYTLIDSGGEHLLAAQEKLLGQTGAILDCYDFPTVKNTFLPIISKLFSKTTSLTIKSSCVSCFQLLIERKAVDRYICVEEILPLFRSMKTRDQRILMKSLRLFEIVPQLVTDDVTLVEQLLPLLWNYSMASTLKASEYSEFVKVINKLTRDIQTQHLRMLNDTKGLDDLEGKNAFDKMIERDSKKPIREDPDSIASRSISQPTIKPKKKTSILSPNYSQVGRTMPSQRLDTDSSLSNRETKNTLATGSEGINPLEPKKLPLRSTNFSTTTTTTTTTVSPNISRTMTPQNVTARTSMSSPQQNRSSLPPGFSIAPLQPSKKERSTPSPMTPNNTEFSLI